MSRYHTVAPPRRLAVLAGLLAVAMVAAACSSSGRRALPATSTSTTSTTVSTGVQYAPSPYSWSTASSVPGVGGGATSTLSAALAPELTGPWLVIGTVQSASGSPSATLWSSSDATSWVQAPLDPQDPVSEADAAARYETSTVVVGSVGTGSGQHAAAWISARPGGPFEPVGVTPARGSSIMTSVAAGALGMFATGTIDGRLAVWSSTDGRNWSELPAAEKTIESTPGARVNAMLAEGGSVFAAGSVQSGAYTQAALWTSTDGLHWHLVTSAASAFAGPGSRVIYSLAPLGTGLVAVGGINRGAGWQPASWISPDGLSWSQPSTDFPGLPSPDAPDASYGPSGGSAARAVAAVPTLADIPSVVATAGGPAGEGAWRSNDGLHWTSLALPAAQEAPGAWRPGAIAATTTSTVVVDTDPGRPYVMADAGRSWSQPSADPAVFGPVSPSAFPLSLSPVSGALDLAVRLETPTQAIGPPANTVEWFTSSDGRAWNTAQAPPVPAVVPSRPVVVTSTPDGWSAVGPGPGAQPQAWSSVDGSAWLPQGSLGPSSPSASAATATCLLPLAPAGSSTTTSGPPATTAPPTTGSGYALEVVGSAVNPLPAGSPATAVAGRVAAAWTYGTATGWKRATVASSPVVGATESLAGCSYTAGGLVGYGTGTNGSGAPEPALWHSTDGSSWARQTLSGFGTGSTAPILSLAAGGGTWLAVTNPDPAVDSPAAEVSGLATPTGPGGAAAAYAGPAAMSATDAAVGPVPTLRDGQVGLWVSTDGGSAWQPLDTSAGPWAGTQSSQVDLVAFAGRTPVVVGTVDGRLTVWTGSRVAGAGGA